MRASVLALVRMFWSPAKLVLLQLPVRRPEPLGVVLQVRAWLVLGLVAHQLLQISDPIPEPCAQLALAVRSIVQGSQGRG